LIRARKQRNELCDRFRRIRRLERERQRVHGPSNQPCANAYAHSYANPDPDCHSDAHTNSDAYSHADCHSDAYAYSNCYAKSDR